MCLFPSAKVKAIEEVDKFISAEERLPTAEDRESFPYIQALVLELFRWGLVTPFSIPRCALEDVWYEGRVIPKGTTILPNNWYVCTASYS